MVSYPCNNETGPKHGYCKYVEVAEIGAAEGSKREMEISRFQPEATLGSPNNSFYTRFGRSGSVIINILCIESPFHK